MKENIKYTITLGLVLCLLGSCSRIYTYKNVIDYKLANEHKDRFNIVQVFYPISQPRILDRTEIDSFENILSPWFYYIISDDMMVLLLNAKRVDVLGNQKDYVGYSRFALFDSISMNCGYRWQLSEQYRVKLLLVVKRKNLKKLFLK